MNTLFYQPKYTIDSSALFTLMNSGEKYDKENFKNLWDDVCNLCKSGKIVSHIQVLEEIKEGGIKEQITWAKNNKFIFLKYNLPAEGEVIKEIEKLLGFDLINFIEQGKQKSTNADPWLIAQAKINNLVLINEESQKKFRIPKICLALGVRSMNILDLIKEENWTY